MPVVEIAAVAAAAMLVQLVSVADLAEIVAHLVDAEVRLPAFAGKLAAADLAERPVQSLVGGIVAADPMFVPALVAQRAALPLAEALLAVAFSEPALGELGIQLL